MENHVINPDSPMIKQSDGMWQKYLMCVLWKLAPNGVIITHKDLEQIIDHEEKKAVLVHGHTDSIEFKLVTMEEAERLADYEATRKGTS